MIRSERVTPAEIEGIREFNEMHRKVREVTEVGKQRLEHAAVQISSPNYVSDEQPDTNARLPITPPNVNKGNSDEVLSLDDKRSRRL